jgi:hypothetical protein
MGARIDGTERRRTSRVRLKIAELPPRASVAMATAGKTGREARARSDLGMFSITWPHASAEECDKSALILYRVSGGPHSDLARSLRTVVWQVGGCPTGSRLDHGLPASYSRLAGLLLDHASRILVLGQADKLLLHTAPLY